MALRPRKVSGAFDERPPAGYCSYVDEKEEFQPEKRWERAKCIYIS